MRFAYLLPGLLLLSALGDALEREAPVPRHGAYLACNRHTLKVKPRCKFGCGCRFARGNVRDAEEARLHNLFYDHNVPCTEAVCTLDECQFNHNRDDGYTGRKEWQVRPSVLPKLKQKGGSCQSHALAGWLTTWIEENDKELAEWFRLKGEGHRLYETLFRRFSEEHELWRQAGYPGGVVEGKRYKVSDYNLFYHRMLADYMPGTIPGRTFNCARNRSIRNNKVLLVEYAMSPERHADFSKIGKDPHALTRFLSKKNSAKKFDGSQAFTKAQFVEHYGEKEGLEKWRRKRGATYEDQWAGDTVGHVMTCFSDGKRVGIKNSWGTDWADDGTVYLNVDAFEGDEDFEFIRFEVPSGSFRADKVRELERIHRGSGQGGGVCITRED